MRLADLQEKENYINSNTSGHKSIYCIMVLRLMDTEEYSNNYCAALDIVLEMFPEIDMEELEKELDRYI